MNLIRTSTAQVVFASWRPALLLALILLLTLLIIFYTTGDLIMPLIWSIWLWVIVISTMTTHELGHLLAIRFQSGSINFGKVHSSWTGVWVSIQKNNKINMQLVAFMGPAIGALSCFYLVSHGSPKPYSMFCIIHTHDKSDSTLC